MRAGNNLNDQDKELWNIIIDVPKLTIPIAALCAFLNFAFSGFGSITCGYLATREGTNKT